MLEIGSDFWDVNSYLVQKRKKLWWEENNYFRRYFKSGRNAIKALLSISQNYGIVALPEYTCETVIQPFVDEGWKIAFYEINKDLSINVNSLVDVCNIYKPNILYIQQYFGFDTSKIEDILLSKIDKNIIVVEDITQSLISNFHIKSADFYVGSLRKFIAIPDGGVLISSHRLDKIQTMVADLTILEIANNAFKLKEHYFNTGDVEIKKIFRKEYEILHERIAINDELRNISDVSLNIFKEYDFEEIKNIRKRNYNVLYTHLADNEDLTTLLDLKEPVCPLYYPVMVNNIERKSLQQYLAKYNIYCPIIWPKSKYILKNSEVAENVYSSILCFPIDQRYNEDDMLFIVNKIHNYRGTSKSG